MFHGLPKVKSFLFSYNITGHILNETFTKVHQIPNKIPRLSDLMQKKRAEKNVIKAPQTQKPRPSCLFEFRTIRSQP